MAAEDPRSPEFDAIIGQRTSAESTIEQDEELQQLAADVDDFFQEADDARSGYSQDWEFFRRYLKGEQRIARNRDSGEIVRIVEEDARHLRSQNNTLRPTSRSLVGKLTRSVPTCEVVPATADFEEQHGARVATALLAYGRRDQRLDMKYVQAVSYLPYAGNSFLYLEWNPRAGRPFALCPVCDYNTSEEELIDQPCPACGQQRQNEEIQLQLRTETAQMQAMKEVMTQFPEGTQPSPDMMPQDIEQPEPEQLGPLPLGEEIPMLEMVFEGAPRIRVLGPQKVYPEAGAVDIETAQAIGIQEPLPVSELKRMYPEYAEFICAEGEVVLDQVGQMGYGGLEVAATATMKDHAWHKILHEAPTERFPHGRVIYKVNELIVKVLGIDLSSDVPLEEQEDNPYHALGRFPIYHLGFDKNPDEFWHEPYIAQAWHRQRELNRSETHIREHVEFLLKPKILTPIGCRLSADEITSQSAQVLAYAATGGEPKPLQMPSLPPEVFQRRNELAADIRMQASVTDQDMGTSPTDPNGRAIAIIEAESDQQIGPIMVHNLAEWREMHRGYLILFRTLGHPETKFSIPGKDGVQTYCFDELLLRPGWDIQLEEDDGLSKNKAIRMNQALELLNAGVFMDPMTGMPDIKAFMRHAKLNLPKAGYDLEQTERAAASQIPYEIQNTGQWSGPQPIDDPAIFAEELLGWLRGPGRRKRVENPQLFAMVMQIWMYYVEWHATQMMPQLGQMGQMGQPGGQQQGGSGPGGPDMSAPGGTPNNPGMLGTDLTAQAGAQVQQADQAAESSAQVQQNREG